MVECALRGNLDYYKTTEKKVSLSRNKGTAYFGYIVNDNIWQPASPPLQYAGDNVSVY